MRIIIKIFLFLLFCCISLFCFWIWSSFVCESKLEFGMAEFVFFSICSLLSFLLSNLPSVPSFKGGEELIFVFIVIVLPKVQPSDFRRLDLGSIVDYFFSLSESQINIIILITTNIQLRFIDTSSLVGPTPSGPPALTGAR